MHTTTAETPAVGFVSPTDPDKERTSAEFPTSTKAENIEDEKEMTIIKDQNNGNPRKTRARRARGALSASDKLKQPLAKRARRPENSACQ